MRKWLVGLAALVAASIVPAVNATAALASTGCQPPSGATVFAIHNQQWVYVPTTEVAPYWQDASLGDINLGWEWNISTSVEASMTATVSAEAGVIFAKASTSVGVGVSKTWSNSTGFNGSVHIAQSPYKYRLHLYEESLNFLVNKVIWSYQTCSYHEAYGYPSTVSHAPRKDGGAVWRVDKEHV